MRDGAAEAATPLPEVAPETAGFATDRLDRLDDSLQGLIDVGHYAGISVTVARHGRLVKSRRFGYQVLGESSPLREDAIYRIASMTKPVIAVAMLILYEHGRWQLDDPVTRFVPEFDGLRVLQDGRLVPPDRPMTMRHLMSSSAGFATGSPVGSTNPEVDTLYASAGLFDGTNDDIIAKLAALPLESHPGTEFRYAIQQEVQGAILRRITGEQLDTLLDRLVFRPLGMTDTGFDVAPDQRDRIPPRYALDDDLRLVLAADQSPFPAVAGTPPGAKPIYLLSIAGLYSTAQDYLRFAQMLANGGALEGVRLIAPSSVRLMTTNLLAEGVPVHFLEPFVGLGYGMNVAVVLDPSRASFTGGPVGVGTYFWGGVHGTWFSVDPVTGVVIVGMVQQQDGGNPMTGRPYPVPDIAAMTRSIVYGALVVPEKSVRS